MAQDEMVNIGADTATLSELAGLDLSVFKETRDVTFPVGYFMWEVIADPEPPKLKKLGDGPGFVMYSKCINVIEVKDEKECPDGKKENLLGKVHRETFFISDLERDFGRVVALLNDLGVGQRGKLDELGLKAVGVRYAAPIVHTPNRKDKDAKPFVNLNREKIMIQQTRKLGATPAPAAA